MVFLNVQMFKVFVLAFSKVVNDGLQDFFNNKQKVNI